MKLVVALAILCGSGCASNVDVLWRVDAGLAFVDAGPRPTPWGTFAASLDIPPCGEGYELVVDTTEEGDDTPISDLSQAGETLSLIEALRLYGSRSGPTNIRFSPLVFPVEAPATITLRASHRGVARSDGLCLDARNRGVVIDWSGASQPMPWTIGPGSLTVGLVFKNVPGPQYVGRGGTLAGCRIEAQLFEAKANGLIGPGNVFVNHANAVQIYGEDCVIRGNFFGYDPLGEVRTGSLHVGVVTFFGGLVENNRFSTNFAFNANLSQTNRPLIMRNNQFSDSSLGLLAGPGRFIFGPDNVVRRTASPAVVGEGRLELTQNSITDCPFWELMSTVTPPTITAIAADRTYPSRTTARGTCPIDGRVELFNDPGTLGELFIESTMCTNGAWESSPMLAPVSPGLHLTATLTVDGVTSAFSSPVALP